MDERAAERPETLPSELAWRLREVEATVSPEEIAELWVFPPLSDVEHSSEFLLFTRYLENERRRLYTARIPADVMAADGLSTSGPASTGTNGTGAGAAANGGVHRNGAGGNDDGAERNGLHGRAAQEIRDHGTVPAERMPRFVEKFLRRLEGEAREPIHVEVNGCRQRWFALLPASTNGNGGAEGQGTNGGHPPSRR